MIRVAICLAGALFGAPALQDQAKERGSLGLPGRDPRRDGLERGDWQDRLVLWACVVVAILTVILGGL